MQLVAEFQALTNPNAILKATKLQAIQAQFLSSSETALIWATPNSDYNKFHSHLAQTKLLMNNNQLTKLVLQLSIQWAYS